MTNMRNVAKKNYEKLRNTKGFRKEDYDKSVYNIKKGMLKATDKVADKVITAGTLAGEPVTIATGTFFKKNKDGLRNVIMEESDIKYLDKAIREACEKRERDVDYYKLDEENRKIADAMWRKEQWEKEGLNEKRKTFNIDPEIDRAVTAVLEAQARESLQKDSNGMPIFEKFHMKDVKAKPNMKPKEASNEKLLSNGR